MAVYFLLLNRPTRVICRLTFDRNRKGTHSDLMYDPLECRNISLDIRYCLFVIDKVAGDQHLINEMTIIQP